MTDTTAQQTSPTTGTPAAQWRVEGKPDPHAGHYDGERTALTLGMLTDDELANGVFLNADQPLDIKRMLARDPTYHAPIVWLTAAKERIRWLSRALVRSEEALGEQQIATGSVADVIKRLRATDTPHATPLELEQITDDAADALETAHARIRELEQQQAAPRGTSAQIQHERSLTCEQIEGAIAFGYRGDPAPEAGHWLEPYWKIGRDRAEHERTHLSDDDLAKLRHMLGMDPRKRRDWGYRNYYATSGGSAMDALERMQTLGLVKIYSIRDGMKYYAATEAGCKAAGLDKKQTKRALED